MGWSFTNPEHAGFIYQSNAILVAADGNNVACCCPVCSEAPVLFVYQGNRDGSREDRPAICPGCQAEFFLEPSMGQCQSRRHVNLKHQQILCASG